MSEVETKAPTVDWMIDKYVQIRERKRALEAKHKEELSKYNDGLARIEGLLLQAMQDNNLNSMKSVHGTAYKATRTSAKVVDWVQTLQFIRANEAWDLLERRVSKLAVQAVMEETKQPIPGVECASEICVNVRKG